MKISDKELLNALLENIPDSIYFKDLESRFIRVSKQLVNRFNVKSEEDIIGKTDFDFFSSEHASQAFQDEQEIIRTGKPIINKEEKETFEGREDRWVLTTKVPFYNSEGKIVGTFGISKDITDKKKIEFQLLEEKNKAEELAKKAMQADLLKSEFLANMSHEIRTPMNAILGFAEILKDQLKEPQYQKYIDIILSSGKTLLDLINDILDISKIEAGKLTLQYRPVNPQELFLDISRIFSEKINSKGLKLLTEIDEKLPKAILIDEVRLRQILFNLVGNAIKFTSKGYIELKVKGIYYPDRSKIDLIFSVKDTGIGISEEDKSEIFNYFQQSKNLDVKKYGGTGLGLAITKKLVNLMNGEIEVESTVGKGSTFNVILRNVSVASIDMAPLKEETKELVIKFKGQKVLVTDDIESNRLLLNKILTVYNLRVFEASNGLEALNIAKRNKPDVILMDLRMPIMDGYEAIKKIKDDPDIKNIPVIVLTASAMKSDESEIKKINCDGYIRKPVRRFELIKELKKHLDYEEEQENIDFEADKKEKVEGEILGSKKVAKKTEKEKRKEKLGIESKKAALKSEHKVISKELIKEITESILPLIDKVKKELIINDIEDFAKRVKALGINYNDEKMVNLSEAILKYCMEFDINNVLHSIEQLANYIVNLKSNLKSNL